MTRQESCRESSRIRWTGVKARQVSAEVVKALETSQRVLIIDPETATRSSLAETLRSGGLDVDVCDGLGEAARPARENRYGVVLTEHIPQGLTVWR